MSIKREETKKLYMKQLGQLTLDECFDVFHGWYLMIIKKIKQMSKGYYVMFNIKPYASPIDKVKQLAKFNFLFMGGSHWGIPEDEYSPSLRPTEEVLMCSYILDIDITMFENPVEISNYLGN